MYKIGRTIFADKETGRVIYNTGEITTTDPEYEEKVNYYESIQDLADRVRESIFEVKLEIGQLEQDFREGILDRIDPETKELFFDYPDPADPEAPQEPRKPLSVEVDALKQADIENKQAIAELTMMVAAPQA